MPISEEITLKNICFLQANEQKRVEMVSTNV